MKAFFLSLAILVVVSFAASFVLEGFARPGESYFTSQNVRLD